MMLTAVLAAVLASSQPSAPPPPPLVDAEPGPAPAARAAPTEPPPPVDAPPPARVAPSDAPLAEPWPGARSGVEQPYYGGPIPPGAHVVEHNNVGLTIASTVVLIGLYGISLPTGFLVGLLEAIFDNESSMFWLMVPVVGPFFALATRHEPSTSTADEAATLRAMLWIDGIGQVAGLATLVYSLASRGRALVFTPEVAGAPRSALQFQLVPGAPGTPLGATVRLLNF